MDVFEAIYNRHSQGKVKPDPLPRELIEKLLSAAVQAPNHYKVRPWRFVVLTGSARNKLGDVFAASLLDRKPDLPQEALDKFRGLPLRAPVVIAVGVDKPSEEKAHSAMLIIFIGSYACLCKYLIAIAGFRRSADRPLLHSSYLFLTLENSPTSLLCKWMFQGFPDNQLVLSCVN